jgi:tetratricopeptide (TPR) repeat protein
MLYKIRSIFLALFFLLFPLFFLPVTIDPYDFNKLLLLWCIIIICLLISVIRVVKKGSVKIIKSPYILPLFLITAITLISALIQSPNFTLTLITPLGTGTIIAGFILFLILSQIPGSRREKYFLILIFDGVLLSLYTFAMYRGFIKKDFFSPAGNLLSTASFLAFIAFYSVLRIINSRFRHSKRLSTIVYCAALLIILPGLILLLIHLTTDQVPVILPLIFGIKIFTEIFKNLRTSLLGVGSANFLTAFTLVKPPALNQTPLWNITFTSSTSFFLTLATENGLISTISYLVLIFITAINLIKKSPVPWAMRTCLLLMLIACLFLPLSMTNFIFFVVLLAFSQKETSIIEIRLPKSKIISLLGGIPVFILILFIAYATARIYLGEVFYHRGITELSQSQGTNSYKDLTQAVRYNPYPDRYRLALSQTDLGLANALAGKKNLSEEDKQNIPKLVSQSIEEARAAIILNRTNPANWDNLSRIYATLSNFAQGAQNWAVDSAKQMLALDPVNPSVHLTVGGYYLRAKRFAEAEIAFREAINLKPDLSNAHYNLAVALRAQEKYKEAQTELSATIALLPTGSEIKPKVEEELNNLEKSIPFPITLSPPPAFSGENK